MPAGWTYARRWLLAAACLAAAVPLSAQDNTIQVRFSEDPVRTAAIGIFRDKGTLYASLNDLADVCSLGVYENRSARKLEVKHPPYRLKVTGGNPFVVATDQEQRQSVRQLPVPVLFAANTTFVPLEPFLPFFGRVFSKELAYEASVGVLRIGPPIAATSFDIPTLRLETKANGMLITIPAQKRLADIESWLRQDGWFYVTVADARADTTAIARVPVTGIVRNIVAVQSPTSVQLTFKLSEPVAATEIIRSEATNDIMISLRTPTEEEKKPSRPQLPSGFGRQRDRWQLDVIVIDPGHGGKDWGATGVSGVREKDITLGIGLKLGRLIKKAFPSIDVVYTRRDDRFIELDRRGQIANEADGKLFISIHCNSLKRKPSRTRGFEVYLLRPGRTAEAIAIAERENAVIEMEEGYEKRYKELTEENFILVTMAQSAHVKASELFAEYLQRAMARVTGVPNRGVKQAGFYVLVGAAMPNVLLETAYLSSREDERFLKSDQGQQKIAESVVRAIGRYKTEYEKLLQEGKDLGDAGAR
jgi:N-acetylmuramoyl-L-alanine amidase